LLFNNSTSLKLSVIDKCQVVFFNPILDGEEDANEKPNKRISTTKDEAQRKYDNCMRLEITQVIGKIIYKLLFNFSIFLFSLMA
jgi:hypothetical protein